jgi:hypothetical protein
MEILKGKDLFLLCRFRTSNHRLPIEIGRWQSVNREHRVCNLCQGRELGDEYHYLFECTECDMKHTSIIGFSNCFVSRLSLGCFSEPDKNYF